MAALLPDARAWLESRYQRDGLPAPGFRWADRDAPRKELAAPGSALLVSDPALRLHLLVLDLGGCSDPASLAARVRADLQAAWDLLSGCRPGTGTGRPGAAGAWRVAVHWLAEEARKPAWLATLARLRQDAALSQELALDATFLEAGANVGPALERHGFPALLLGARAALRRDVCGNALWASADDRVRQAVAALDARGFTPMAAAIAGELRAVAAEPAPGSATPLQAQPRRLGTVVVEQVRGIRRVTLGSGARPQQAWVVAGPNGSGKSSLAEAVSLRAFGSSRGLCAFLQDPDASKGRTPAGYLDRYLTPLGGGQPRCSVDGDAGILALAPDLASAAASLAEAEGTLVEQGGPGGFLATSGEDLGARMARSFSSLATRLEAWTAQGRAEAGEARTALARRYGISPSTRLASSFREKIARSLVERRRRPAPAGLPVLLGALALLPGPLAAEAAALREAWKAAGEPAGEDLARLRPASREALEGALEARFTGDAERLARTRSLLERLAGALDGPGIPAAGLAPALEPWAAWLDRTHSAAPPAPVVRPEAAAPPAAQAELDALLAQRSALAAEGGRTRPLRDHLAQTLAFLRAQPHAGHAPDCPTCRARLERPAEEVVAEHLAGLDARLQEQREAYAALTRRIKALETDAPGPGAEPCPVPADTRRQLQAAAAALLGPAAQVEELLRDPARRQALATLLQGARSAAAAAPQPADPGPEAAACAAELLAAWAEAERVLAEPEAWDQVAGALTACLNRVVAEHLPATLEGLWRELAASLSPAPWLLPAAPRFQTRTLRGSNRVDVVLDGPDGEPRLARHLLNTAQADTLGLAWTFCQHLVQSRFRHAWMLLDDPVRDLDPAAHRAFCRFLAALVSLYEASGLAFTLVLLLGQEDRALNAARELGQDLQVLAWTGRQDDAAVRRLELFGADVRSPQPEDLWGAAAS